MGMFDVEYSFDNLIRTTSGGVEVSSFVQVKDAIIKRYKEIFGNDIDIESTTADGQYVMMLALMLYNGYNGVYYLNQNLDPAGAQGVFLDRLCSFNNIFRNNAEPSYAYLYVNYIGNGKNYTSNIDGGTIQEITCVDKSGKLWQWQEGMSSEGYTTKFNKDEIQILKFVCEENGPIVATADSSLIGKKGVLLSEEDIDATSQAVLNKDNHGDISAVIDQAIYPFEVWQASSAVLGNDEETDASLRQRRVSELGNNGTTVVNGIIGGLFTIPGVEEVKLYNNANDTVAGSEIAAHDITTKNGSTIKPHDIYLCIRYKDGVSVDSLNTNIGNMIYQKITPGIVTVPLNNGVDSNSRIYNKISSNNYGESEFYKINVYGDVLTYNIYWTKCLGIYPSLRLKFYRNPATWISDTHEKAIRDAFINYTYNLTIYDDLVIPNILSALNAADERPNNQTTFMFVDGVTKSTYTTEKIEASETTGLVQKFDNKDTYYSYQNDVKFEFVSSEETSGGYIETYLYIYKPIYYTVSFDTDGGSEVSSQSVEKNEKATRPTTDPTKPDDETYTYTFDKWYKDSEKTTVFNFGTEVITSNTTIYAKWNETPKS